MKDRKKFYPPKWFMWIILVLFVPGGIPLVLLQSSLKLNKRIKFALIGVLILFCALLVGLGGRNVLTKKKVILSIAGSLQKNSHIKMIKL